jgi:hypothetical protein
VQRAHCGCKRREVVTAAGTVTLRRVYYRCSRCTQGGYALDERLGIQGRYSPDARRLICLAGGSWSYDVAAAHLRELSGLVVSDTTVRELCQAEGALMAVWQRTAPAVRAEFAAAEGEVEFTTDGTMVNTTDGWQEMKLGLFAKRPRGDAATPDEWDERDLPKPTARVGFAAIEASDRFGARWDQWAARLGVKDTSTITVLADGAKWIWDEARRNLIGSAGVLDVYHALEHVHAAAKTLFGDGTDAAREWTDQARTALLERGWTGIEDHLQHTPPPDDPTRLQALPGLRNYLGNHVSHLHYAERLAEGRSIGSGQVEGACKNLIGRRLKQTGARWRVRRVNRMASLCCLAYSHAWKPYWEAQAT